MKKIAMLLCLVAATAAWAMPDPTGRGPGAGPGPGHGQGVGQGLGRGSGGPGGPPRGLYPPEMVLSNQLALGLTDDQLQSLKSMLKATHESTLDTQVALQRAVETLQRTLDSTRVDEAAALAAADQVMALETAMKKGHLGLMIRVKNLLTPDQQKKLEEMRPPQPPQPPQPPAPPAR